MDRFFSDSCLSFQLPIIKQEFWETDFREYRDTRDKPWPTVSLLLLPLLTSEETHDVVAKTMGFKRRTEFRPHHWLVVPPLAGHLTSLGLSFLIYKLRDEVPSMLKIPKVYSLADKCMRKLESGQAVFQMSLEIGGKGQQELWLWPWFTFSRRCLL